MKRLILLAATLSGALTILSGCQQPAAQMSMDMQPAPRAVELDSLNMLVGKWEGSWEMRMPESKEVVKGSGLSESTWEADKRVVLERFEGTMGDDQHKEKMSGVGIWTWDAKAKKFQTFWTDSYGGMSHGTATYDAATRTFSMKGEGEGPMGETHGEGTMRVLDNNTLEYKFTEWNKYKTKKLMEMTGTSKRRS